MWLCPWGGWAVGEHAGRRGRCWTPVTGGRGTHHRAPENGASAVQTLNKSWGPYFLQDLLPSPHLHCPWPGGSKAILVSASRLTSALAAGRRWERPGRRGTVFPPKPLKACSRSVWLPGRPLDVASDQTPPCPACVHCGHCAPTNPHSPRIPYKVMQARRQWHAILSRGGGGGQGWYLREPGGTPQEDV